MANPHRGQVSLEVGEKAYTLKFSVNAICELEDALNQDINTIVAALSARRGVRMKMLRAMVWAALREHHENTSLKDAGDILGEAGVPLVMEKMGAALTAAFPEASGSKKKATSG